MKVSLKSLFLNRSSIALGAFFLKSLFAFIISSIVGNYLPVHEFGLWSYVFAVAMIVGVSELGVGQFVMTYFHTGAEGFQDFKELASNSIAVTVVTAATLALASHPLAAKIDKSGIIEYLSFTLFLLSIRVVASPYNGFLSAINRFHERKIIEATTYAILIVVVKFCVYRGASLGALLLTANSVFAFGSLLAMARAYQLGFPKFDFSNIRVSRLLAIVMKSLPYFMGNVTSIATYSGLVVAASTVLDVHELGRFALLHTVFLMSAIQILEVVLRTVQIRLGSVQYFNRLQWIIVKAFTVSTPLILISGDYLVKLIFPKFSYTVIELFFFWIMIGFESLFLLSTLAMQVNSRMGGILQLCSISKAAACAGAIAGTSFFFTNVQLTIFVSGLAVVSCISSVITWRCVIVNYNVTTGP